MNVRDLATSKNELACRNCSSRVGEDRWKVFVALEPRPLVIFECLRCSNLRYLELAGPLARTEAGGPYCARCGKTLARGPIGGGHFDYLECKH